MTGMEDARGRRVISRATAEPVGEVRGYVVDAVARRVTALHVAGKGRRARLVDWAQVTGFGPDAVMIADEDALREPADEREEAAAKGDLDIAGRRVLDDTGTSLGTARDAAFDEATGALGAITTEAGSVEATRLRAVGPYAIVVRADG